ncbi:MAG: hypothetical protein IPL63_14590 [Saprospiraceae bacterium]|nr:hypothetical protein [Saprospiraceae bacterium]MBK6566243.1 hypothetical protein [Saprospiraceae bacterium]MBK8080560.1 hypothetical protein [Saprospiraceae bacterium]MBK8372914.1 hypothetical protein [Saprospiraceae bacterium]MBK8548538.1 hypothetical protein [Saprospiraceae bacterium]
MLDFRIIFVLNTLLLLIGCSSVHNNKRVNYNNSINEIKLKIEDLTWIEEPLTINISKSIVENPALYIDSLILLIKNPEIDTINKEIGLVLMKNLDKDKSYLLTDSISSYLPPRILKLWITGFYGNRMLMKDKDFLLKKYKII